jgi:hypothetical protein
MKKLIKKIFGHKPNVIDTNMITRKMERRYYNNTGRVRSSELVRQASNFRT